ncbi:insulinase family protein [Candidatus Saccharibacteria bacterium]|nr:insulinase family protein [Candidatus Saccharibacteria bacterium]
MKHSLYEVNLKNGAKGLLVDVPGASVMNIRIQFRAGMRYAKNHDLYEIAHVVEHLSFGANAKYRDEQAYESDFTKNGAYHNAWTSDFSVCYESECADFEWERILDLNRVAITSPRFNDEELKSEKGNVRSELTGYLNDYSRLIWPRLQTAIGEDTPNLRERINTLSNIELKDIREHYRRTHTASNMLFIIAGRVKHRRHKIIRMLEQWDLKPGELSPVPNDTLHSSDAVLIRRKDASNITFGFSFVIPRRISEVETRTMDCLNHIVTGTTSSRIFGKARKNGLAYGISSCLTNSVHNSSWDFDGEVNLEDAEALFKLIQRELKKILDGEISEKEIEAARSYVLGRYQMGAQTVSQISDYYMESYFVNREVDNYNNTPGIIKSIDKDAIVKLAREYASSDIKALVAVGSCEKATITNLSEYLKNDKSDIIET